MTANASRVKRLFMGPLFIPEPSAVRRGRGAIAQPFIALSPRLLADTVWLISFHDLINHSISARRRISGVLKASDRHKRRTVMTLATDTNTRRADLRMLDKYLLPPPHTLLRLIRLICFAGESEVQRLESRDGENCFNGSFSAQGERLKPSSTVAFSHVMAQQELSKPF